MIDDEAVADLKWAAECATKSAQRLPEGSKEQKREAEQAHKFHLALAAKLFDCGRVRAAALAFDDIASTALPSDSAMDASIADLQNSIRDIWKEEMGFQVHEAECQNATARLELRRVDPTEVGNENFQRYCVDSGYTEMEAYKPKDNESTQTHPSLKVLDQLNAINSAISEKIADGREFPMSLILHRAQTFLRAGLHMDALRDAQIARSKFPSLVEPAFVVSVIHSAAGLAEDAKRSSSVVGRLQFYSLVRRDLQKSRQWQRWLAFELRLPKPSELVEASAFVLAHGGVPMAWLMDRMIQTLIGALSQAKVKAETDSSHGTRVIQLEKTLAGLHINRALIFAHQGNWTESDLHIVKAQAVSPGSVSSEIATQLGGRSLGPRDMRGFWQSLYI